MKNRQLSVSGQARVIRKLSILLVLFGSCLPTYAQMIPGGAGDSDRIEGKTKFIPLPYVDYGVQSGFTLGAIPLLMFNVSEKDTISPSSVVGFLAMYSQSETWFMMTFGRLFLKEDDWRITYAAGLGDIQFQFYENDITNKWYRYNTNADFAYVGVQKQVAPDLYVGPHYIYTTFKTNSEFFADSVATELNGLGLDVSYDRRSNVSYPRSGYYAALDVSFFPKAFGNANESSRATFELNKFNSMKNGRDVLATRFYAGVNLGDVTFNQQFIVGETDIRGYSFGEFRGEHMLALQGEYRWNFRPRIGAVGFFGLATVFESPNSSDNGKILPGIGTGFRYVFVEDTHSTVGFDIAKGLNDWGFYFRFTEAF